MTDFPLPEAIQWHEGMLLAPQHFQQHALRQEALLHHHLAAMAPFHWGVRKLVVDPSLLVDGVFRINHLDAVMPDSLIVFHPHADEGNLEIDLRPRLDQIRNRPLTIHVVVPAQRGESPARGELARFKSVGGAPVADANTGDGEVRIPRLRPRVGLITGDKPPEKYVSFPLAQITYRSEALSMSDFVPPCLEVATDSPLGRRCSFLSKRLREKAVFLSERLMSPSSRAGDAMATETRGLIRSLVAGLPLFEAVTTTGVSHPHAVYLALCAVVGHLSALSSSQIPPALPPYNHNDLRGTFDRALDFALRTIDEVRETYVAVPFIRDGGGFRLGIPAPWLGQHLTLGARAAPRAADRETIEWIERSLIGSASLMDGIEARRVRGAGRRQIDKDDALGVVPSRGTVLFAIDGDPAHVRPEEDLVVINPSDPRGEQAPAELVLYVAAPQAEGGPR